MQLVWMYGGVFFEGAIYNMQILFWYKCESNVLRLAKVRNKMPEVMVEESGHY